MWVTANHGLPDTSIAAAVPVITWPKPNVPICRLYIPNHDYHFELQPGGAWLSRLQILDYISAEKMLVGAAIPAVARLFSNINASTYLCSVGAKSGNKKAVWLRRNWFAERALAF